MWLWLVVSIVILAACIIFALRIFATTYNLTTPQLNEKALSPKSTKVLFPIFRQESSIHELKAKIKTIEDDYLAHFNKLQQRIDFLDHEKNSKVKKWKEEDNEGWEELYYKALKDKEAAEELLDELNQKQAELIIAIKEFESKEHSLNKINEKNESDQAQAQVFKSRIDVLEHEAEVALERERILNEELNTINKIKRDHELLQHLYSHLLTEADDLKLRIHEITNRDISLTQKINRLNELESNFQITEFEKSDLRRSVEEIIIENETLSTKLQELQDKLATEKHA